MTKTETKQENILRIGGLPGGAEAWWLWQNREKFSRCLVLTASDETAQILFDDFQALERWDTLETRDRVLDQPQGVTHVRRSDPLPTKERESFRSEAVYFSQDEPEVQIHALSEWAKAPSKAEAGPRFLVASWEMAKHSLPSPQTFQQAHRVLRLGDKLDRSKFLVHLAQMGYSRTDSVEQAGEMAVRGEVVDLWSPGWEFPVRLLWPYDQIESIRKIDLTTQRSSDAIDSVTVRPAHTNLNAPGEFPLTPTLPSYKQGPGSSDQVSQEEREKKIKPRIFMDKGEGIMKDSSATLIDYLGEGGTLFESNLPDEAEVEWAGQRIIKTELGAVDQQEPFEPLPPFGDPTSPGRIQLFIQSVQDWVKKGSKVVIFCHNPGEQERLEEVLLENDRHLAQYFENRQIDLPIGFFVGGFQDPTRNLALLCQGLIFGRYRRRLRLPKFTGGKDISAIAELSAGDYVVHERFGIGRYKGLERVKAAGTEADYLKLEYKGGDRVFVPLFEFKQVQKYIGTEGKKPKLSSIDTATWERTKQEVEASVAELAKELLARAAARATAPGFSFPPDSHLEKEFGSSFHYELTPDQARAIEEVKADMIRPRPMDRLVCGDVGYGKTEVAMRAAFKAVLAHKQVALLVPTTILAEQHGRNFRDRFADYPVSIAVLSRFTKTDEQKRIIADLRRGVIDIVVGTHRLLSADVTFKDLGLVMVDEEHRFGVKQKDRIMAYRDVVDVLALSATPIPRTLGASMSGIKSLSLIQTPPEGRLPINTHVGPFDEKIVLAAVEQELRRGGQVFYVHNRVSSIFERKTWLEKTLNDHGLAVKIGVGHGQMTGAQLEKTMWDFLHKKFNILLATSIIESGLDIPSVNTLIVEEAEDFGLAQLYQLRGRVGRERQRAYCFLFYSPGTGLTDDARKRLTALKEFASLGSGFRLALRDLEIRGAGNILGPQQHGFINAIGVDLYGQLLSDEISRQKGEGGGKEIAPDPVLELPVSAYLPEDYLPSEQERVIFYKRLLDASEKDIESLRAELEDRCGALPDPAMRLFDVAYLRLTAREKKIMKIAIVRRGLEIRFQKEVTLPAETVDRLLKEFPDKLSFLPGPPFGIRIEPPLPGGLAVWTKDFLVSL